MGIDHDTAEFAAEQSAAGGPRWDDADFPSPAIVVTADGGGSNSSRSRLWKVALQKLADETGLTLVSATFRPAPASGTRSSIGCSAISPKTGAANRWSSHEVIVNLIAGTTTATGLKVKAAIDHKYPTRQKITDEQLHNVRLKPAEFHGDWNYTIQPNLKNR